MAQRNWNPSSLCLVAIASHEPQQRSESTAPSATRPPSCDFGLGSRLPPRCERTRCLKTERGFPIPLILHGVAFIIIATPVVYGSSLKSTSGQLIVRQPALGNYLAKSESPCDRCSNRICSSPTPNFMLIHKWLPVGAMPIQQDRNFVLLLTIPPSVASCAIEQDETLRLLSFIGIDSPFTVTTS